MTAPTALPVSPGRRERNLGIDLLRMLSMFMVAILHVCGQGGVLNATVGNVSANRIAWLLEIAGYCCVNCYALISGYVGVKSRFKYSNIILLWLQVFFYTGLVTLLFSIFSPGTVETEQIVCAFFPVMKSQYWYFTAYAGMFFFIPLFNYAVNHMPKRQMGAVIIALTLLFSIVPAFFRAGIFGKATGDVFGTVSGYSAWWLAILYLMGAYISKYNLFEKIPSWLFFGGYLGAVLVTWIAKFFIKGGGVLVNYTSPTILLAGVSLLLLFSRMKLRPLAPVIRFLSPLAFSVYIIHVHPLIWKQFMLLRYASFAELPVWHMTLAILLAALCIYLVCSAIDLVRHTLFRLLRIREGLEALENRLLGNFWKEP